MARKLNIVGGRVRELRNSRNLSLSALAARCGVLGWDVSGGTLAKVESRQRSAFDCELLVLAKALGVETGALYPRHVPTEELRACLAKPFRKG